MNLKGILKEGFSKLFDSISIKQPKYNYFMEGKDAHEIHEYHERRRSESKVNNPLKYYFNNVIAVSRRGSKK